MQITKIKKTEDILTLAQRHLPENPFIIEGGSFTGHDTLRMVHFWPRATIHAFEPVPDIFVQLKENTKTHPTITCHPLALAATTGTAPLHRSEKPKKPGISTQASSLLAPKERLEHSAIIFPEIIEVKTITLDDFAQQAHLDHIDFLWLDLQGYELPVLKAATDILPTIKVIYTEVQFIESYAGNALYPEVRGWLELQGFVMTACDFQEDQTKSFFGNILFVRKEIVHL